MVEDKRIPVYQRLGINNQLQTPVQTQALGLDNFKDKIFYCGKSELDEDDCFNHSIGLPRKDDIRLPLFDYEREIFDLLQKGEKYLWICKSTGLGISEFFLRYIAWRALASNEWHNCKVVIVTGPRIELAITLIDRIKKLFLDIGILFTSNQTVVELNGCRIEAFPSHHVDTMRGLTDVKFVMLDESAFFTIGQQQEVRDASERYIAKSDPYIVMISTPNRPDDMFAKIREEEPSLYKRLYFSYHIGLGKIYTEHEIEEAKRSPSFSREYNLQFVGKIGNVFSPSVIDKSIELGELYKDIPVNDYCLHICGVDPGFSSSKTAVYVGELLKEEKCIRIIYGREYDKDTPSKIADDIHGLYLQYQNFYCYIDGSNRGLVNELKYKFGESTRWEKPEDVFPQGNRILPINFATCHKEMLEHLHNLMSKNRIAIPKEYDLLTIALRTAVAEEWNLKKDDTVNSDSLDALRLLCIPFKFGVRN